jgi:hypothetical protein
MTTIIDYTYDKDNDYHEKFKVACSMGDIDTAQAIYNTEQYLDIKEDSYDALHKAIDNK